MFEDTVKIAFEDSIRMKKFVVHDIKQMPTIGRVGDGLVSIHKRGKSKKQRFLNELGSNSISSPFELI